MNFLILVSFIFLKKLNGQVADPCNFELYQLCVADGNAYAKTPTNPGATQVGTCMTELTNAYKSCKAGQEAGRNAMALATATAGLTTTSNIDKAQAPTTGVSGEAANGGQLYNTCGSTAQTASKSCTQPYVKLCSQYQQHLSTTCPQLAKEAGFTAAQSAKVSEAAGWLKPALIGAAVGAGAMALMGGKKGGDGGGTPPPAPKPDDKLPDLKLNGSTTSAAPTPSVVYYPPSNNNGSLGNPAVIGSTTSTSTPADTVKVAGITPSTSFASGQGSSIGPDTSSRTISSSGAAAPASVSSGDTGSTDSGGGVGGGGSDSASLVDTSGKGAGGGGSFSGGMDGGSGSSAQAASADGTMLTGIPGGKSDPQSAKVKALASKKAQVAQTQSRTTIPKPLAKRRFATPAVKAAPAVNLKQDMRSRGLIK